ncbi:MAG: conserved membrane protein of unknown function [Candidatus Thorarchaeota archaeon]|nr:MAG: conserved membrane protein of unknown function [Candidatus Thorarchaeota archaeon]
MAELNLATVLFELAPALISTIVYLLLFRSKRNRYIEAFLAVLYVRAIFFYIWNIWYYPIGVVGGFTSPVSDSGFWNLFALEYLFHFASALQDFLTWVMVAFFAVLFGMLVLAIKLALQDPMKRTFSNLIKRIIGHEPETDGFSGFRDRLNNIQFDIPDKEPLNPEIISKAYSDAWKDYLIIGLATLLPSIGVYMGYYESFYGYGIIVFLTWIYRFGYPASNRIAKGAGLTLGNKKIGEEMMRGVLGWFFRLNLLLSLGTIGFSIYGLIGDPASLNTVLFQYFVGIVLAFPPVLFAIIIFPLVEDFAVIFYKRTFEALTQLRSKASEFDFKAALANYGASVLISTIGIAAFVGSIMAATLHFSVNNNFTYNYLPGQVDSTVASILMNASSNMALINATRWVLLILAIPFLMILFLGVVGHFSRKRVSGGVEGFAIIGGFLLAVVTWIVFPSLDYILGISPTPMEYASVEIVRLRPLIALPTEADALFRYMSEFLINVPLYIFGTMFVMYYLRSSDRYRQKHGIESGPLVNVHVRDIKDVVYMFFGGLIISAIGIALLSYIIPPGILDYLVYTVLTEIGDPNGLEFIFGEWTIAATGSILPIILEHNLIRTLLMLLIGPVFWSLVLWLIAVRRQGHEEKTNALYSVFIVIFTMAAGLIVSLILLNSTVALTPPWTAEAFIGMIVGILLGILFLGYFLIWLINKIRGTDGGWWFPPLLVLFVLEYFVYDDQFTLIALIVLPMVIALLYKAVFFNKPEVQQQDTLLLYIKFSLMALAISEVLSTALTVGGLAMMQPDPLIFWAGILPHAIIEIPAFLFVAAASLRIARELTPSIMAEEFEKIPEETRKLLTDGRVWRTYLFCAFFLAIAALVETEISHLVRHLAWLFLNM